MCLLDNLARKLFTIHPVTGAATLVDVRSGNSAKAIWGRIGQFRAPDGQRPTRSSRRPGRPVAQLVVRVGGHGGRVELQRVLRAFLAADLDEDAAQPVRRRVAETEQVDIARRSVELIRPQQEEHGALERELARVRGAPKAIQQSLGAKAQQGELEVLAALAGPIEQQAVDRSCRTSRSASSAVSRSITRDKRKQSTTVQATLVPDPPACANPQRYVEPVSASTTNHQGPGPCPSCGTWRISLPIAYCLAEVLILLKLPRAQ